MLIMNDYETTLGSQDGSAIPDASCPSLSRAPDTGTCSSWIRASAGFGADDIEKPFLTFHNAAWDAPYKVFNHMDGEAGASFYAVAVVPSQAPGSSRLAPLHSRRRMALRAV